MCAKIPVSLFNEAKKLLRHIDDEPQNAPVIWECSEEYPEHIFYVAGCDWNIQLHRDSQHRTLIVIIATGDHGPLRAEGKTLKSAFRDMRLEAEIKGAKYALRDMDERNL